MFGTFGSFGCCLVVIVALAAVATADTDSQPPADSTAHDESRSGAPIAGPHEARSEDQLHLKTLDKQLFKRLFVERRKEHLEAVKSLRKIDSYERQYKMINVLAEKMFEVMESKKALLENIADSKASETDVADAVSSVLENVALLGDVVLQLPDIARRVLRTQPKWDATMRWSFEFSSRSRDLLDEATREVIAPALQELDIGKRQAGHSSSPNGIPQGATNRPPPKNAERGTSKRRRSKGPTITRVEL